MPAAAAYRHLRCRVPAEYALATKVDHPATIYLREDQVVPALDKWIATVFDPVNLDDTIASLTEAQAPSEADDARVEAARRALDDANEKIERLVAAIEAGSPADMLGLELTFDATKRLVQVEALPVCVRSCRRGDYSSMYTAPTLKTVLALT